MIRLSPTLSSYLGRHFLIGFGVVIAVLLTLGFLVDLVELLRRASNREGASIYIILQMAVYKLPSLAEQMLPFAALLGAMLSLSRLTNTSELVVARAAGVSAWQFLMPPLIISLLLGGFVVAVYNPLASALFARYKQIESKYLRGKSRLVAVSEKTGLWLRDTAEDGNMVIHAARVSRSGAELGDVIIWLYRGNDTFKQRIDARGALLREGYWDLGDVLVTGQDRPAEQHLQYRLNTTLTLKQILESLAPPRTLSFWQLPTFIDMLESAGFSAVPHRLYWHTVLAGPLLLCAMVLIAATFALRLTRRRRRVGLILLGGVLTGFLVFFLTDIVQALGLSGKLPTALAGWAPAGISAMLGVAMLFHLEDG